MTPVTPSTSGSTASGSSSSGSTSSACGERLAAVTCGGALVCFTARWFIPTENAAGGEQLGWALAWMLLALLWSWCGKRSPFRGSDLAVILIVGGHVLGGLVVLSGGGQRRVAMNLLVEWLGLGAAWFVLREPWPSAWREGLLTTTRVAWLGLAGYACWQHFVELPQMAAEYAPQIAAYRESHAPDLARTLERAGIPLSEPDLTLFEKRLLDSREPFGFFALANTLAGLLAVGLLLTIAERGAWETGRQRILTGGVGFLLGLALLLTKSRTALVGALLGGGMLAGDRWLRSHQPGRWRPILLVVGTGTALSALLVAGLIGSGSWDPEVLTQAPRSLIFRWHYWVGTSRLIARSPLLGIGLGQFRTEYLTVKLPEASEEIADPHQALLDAWVNGGLLAFAGVILLGVCALRQWLTPGSDSPSTPHPTRPITMIPFLVGGLVPWLLLLGQVTWAGTWDDRLLVVGLLGLVGAGLAVSTGWMTQAPTRSAAAIGLLALLVHLQGAGGIAYPAVVQTLWCLLAWSGAPSARDPVETRSVRPDWLSIIGWMLATGIGLGVWIPASRAAAEVAAGDASLRRAGNLSVAADHYRAAVALDPWGTTALGRLAELAQRDWDGKVPAEGELPAPLQAAFTTLDAAIARDPGNGHWRRRTAELRSLWAERSGRATDWKIAAKSWGEAVSRGPTNAEGLVRWSDALAQAGDAENARQTARRAVAQDEINQQWGHVERRLPQETLERLRARIASPSQPSP